jgi:UDP-glucose:(heptosyl)LPS alpha-1,3-glucosyltransferase
MRIALVILHADPQRGGAERYTIDLAAALAAGGHDVSLLATTFTDAPLPPTVKRVDVPVSASTRAGRYRQALIAIDGLTRPGSFEIVHAMFPVGRCDVYHPHAGLAVDCGNEGGLATRLFNPRRAMMAHVERQLLTSGSPPVVLCLSDAMRADVARRYPGLPADRTETLFNAVDLNRFDPGRADIALWTSPVVPSGTPVFAVVAQDFARKGVATAITALAQLPRAGTAPYLVVAGGDRPGSYQRLARRLGVADRVIFTGSTPDVCPLYRAAHALLLPTHSDPCSLVVLEALAMGVPVITTRCNGASEIMADGTHGYILDDPDDVSSLAARMGAILAPQVRGTMVKACLGLRSRLSFDTHVQSLLAIYQTVAGRTAPAVAAPSPPGYPMPR